MIRFTLSQLAAIAHGERQGSDIAIDEVTTDTRKVTAGCLFVALKGERFDAHDFAEQAKAAGAGALLVSRPLACDLPQVIVKDTRQASDELCRERGLSIIRERSAGLRYTQAEQGLNKRGLDSWKDEIREIVDDAKKQARTPEEFRQHLARYQVGMTERGKDRKITYQHPNGRKVRAARLGNDYERPAIEKALQVERPAVSRSAERPREIPKTLEGVEQEHKRRMDSITKPEIEAARIAAEQKRAAERAAREKRLQQERQQPHKHKRNLSIEPPSHGRSGGRGGMER